jgi:hypothetical protein
MTKRHLDWFKTNPEQPMVSHGNGSLQPRDDVALPSSCKPATNKPVVDTSPSAFEQRHAERRRRGVNYAGPAFRRSC